MDLNIAIFVKYAIINPALIIGGGQTRRLRNEYKTKKVGYQ